MEDVLDLYAEPPDPRRPVVCVDERPYQLTADATPPLPLAPGRPRRVDFEYRRGGTCSLLVLFHPAAGWRHVAVSDRRTRADFARWMRDLVDVHFPEAEVVRVVLDNLNTHTPAALYAELPPAEARRITRRLEFHYTPPHGSWLNQAELEIAALARQCLGTRRLADPAALQREIDAWQHARNAARATVDWRFTTDHARTKLARLYPS